MRASHLRRTQTAIISAGFLHHQPPCCQAFRRFYASPSRRDDHLTRLRSEIVSFHHGSVQPRVEAYRKHLTAHTSRIITSLARHATVLGLKLNEVTGYQEVEKLKALVTAQERTLENARHAARQAKLAYDKAVSDRSNAQRDVNSLLERKHSWSDADVMTFTTLVRADHSSTSAVMTTSSTLKDKELAVDKAFSDLTSAILQRYHEEQVWSDKIRSVSTWANIVGLLFNFFIFLIAIAIVEPWKRKRLVERMEERMANLIERVESEVRQVSMRLEQTPSTSEPQTPSVRSPNYITAMASEAPAVAQPSTIDVDDLEAVSSMPVGLHIADESTGDWTTYHRSVMRVINDSLRPVGAYLDKEPVATGVFGATIGLLVGCLVSYWAR